MSVHSRTARKVLATAILLLTLIPGITLSGLNSAPVMADGGPDLVVQEIILSPAEPAIDDVVTITVNVKNQGTEAAPQSYAVCYVDNAVIATRTIGQLVAGTTATATFTWIAEAGSHNIRAIADSSEAVAETDETNNTKTYAITTRSADLVIQSVTWSPAIVSRGDAIAFNIAIQNQGNASSRITNMDFLIDGGSRGYQDVATINPGKTITMTYNWVALAGQHTIKAVVDVANKVKESNEANNDCTITFATEAPDLVIEQITWSPQNPSKNDDVSINATIKNQGTGRADANHLALYIDGELQSTMLVDALEAAISANITFSWKATSGKHEIRSIIDFYHNVAESDENNNEITTSLETIAPDLAVASITWTPADAAVGDTVTLNATIKNRGGGRSEKARAAFYVDGKFAGSPDIPEIDAGEETPITLQWIATGGSHTVSVVADYDNMLAETAEDNNKLTATISIISPDLFIPSIGWLPENFVIDDMVTFSVNITNRGGGRAENFYVAYYMDDILVTSKPVARLDSGASVNKTWTWKALNGRHTFKAIANYNKYIIEENENNNENAVTVAPNMPDLTVETVTWSPADIAAGKDVKFDITIKNTGTLTAGPTRVAYYIDGVVTGFNDIGQLEPGAVVTVHYTWSALAGLHTIDIVTDSTDQVSEIDEANNAKTVSLPPPDLVIQDISWSPEDAATGDPVTLTATVKNQGYSRSQKTQVTCYIDGKAIGTKDLAEIEPGASSQVAFDWTAEPGAHKIKVTADVNNRVTESDETNNFKETDLAALTPDLVVQDITWLMKSPLTDDRVDFVITVRNQGTGKAGASLMIYTVDDMPGLTEDIAALPAGDSVSADFSLILKAGPHTVNVSLDTETEVSELDETNNERSLSFSTIAPDLVIETISLAPADPVPGDNVTITVKLGNQGKDKVLAPKLSLSVDGSPVGEAEAEEIEIGGIASLDFSWIATAGQHDIVAYADISKQITESNETNNSRTRTVSIESPPVQVPKSVNLSTTTDKGLIASWWWLLLVVAALLGGTAFYSALRSFKKE